MSNAYPAYNVYNRHDLIDKFSSAIAWIQINFTIQDTTYTTYCQGFFYKCFLVSRASCFVYPAIPDKITTSLYPTQIIVTTYDLCQTRTYQAFLVAFDSRTDICLLNIPNIDWKCQQQLKSINKCYPSTLYTCDESYIFYYNNLPTNPNFTVQDVVISRVGQFHPDYPYLTFMTVNPIINGPFVSGAPIISKMGWLLSMINTGLGTLDQTCLYATIKRLIKNTKCSNQVYVNDWAFLGVRVTNNCCDKGLVVIESENEALPDGLVMKQFQCGKDKCPLGGCLRQNPPGPFLFKLCIGAPIIIKTVCKQKICVRTTGLPEQQRVSMWLLNSVYVYPSLKTLREIYLEIDPTTIEEISYEENLSHFM